MKQDLQKLYLAALGDKFTFKRKVMAVHTKSKNQ